MRHKKIFCLFCDCLPVYTSIIWIVYSKKYRELILSSNIFVRPFWPAINWKISLYFKGWKLFSGQIFLKTILMTRSVKFREHSQINLRHYSRLCTWTTFFSSFSFRTSNCFQNPLIFTVLCWNKIRSLIEFVISNNRRRFYSNFLFMPLRSPPSSPRPPC